ncbi:Crp/Fnr family transcriptional regulator [Desulfoprunum benzoelyticum]|uniref:CRP/FNR family transcriptional regulator n=1 Tax=Desulfoprunum benzoelyticum TaxID=1506996 RepID=A0A840USJ6_9BACT|nr:Crp/Fnr family transcriptional regulator [Desulfoprunum benzoelyticum]MBB5346344.1 CRP/FNR family transcriptional regulator [Desulfoprunum benzoelyticum]MBM9528657.1 Crp/Fnr family transcriptional regulator [Desulfoprunum benzoelyticum]
MKANQVIGASVLFQGLPEHQIKEIVDIIIERTYGKGESIFFEGDPGHGFYMVGEGKVKIFKMSLGGKEQILHIFGEGEPFGEVSVFHGHPFPASAEALSPTKVLYFPRDKFVALVSRNPSIALNMLAVLSLRLRRFTVQIENLSLKEVPARLAGYILYLLKEQGREDSVELEISKGQLASLLGTIPETLSRIFAKMTEEGLIEVVGRRINILDRRGLEAK